MDADCTACGWLTQRASAPDATLQAGSTTAVSVSHRRRSVMPAGGGPSAAACRVR